MKTSVMFRLRDEVWLVTIWSVMAIWAIAMFFGVR